MIHTQARQRMIGDGLRDTPIAFHNCEIQNPAQQAPSDARRAPRAFRNFPRARIIRRYAQQFGIARDNLVQLSIGVKFQSRRNAKAVTQGGREQTQTSCGPDQRERLQLNAHRARRRPLANDKVQFKILQCRIKNLFHHRIEAMNFINK